MTQETDLVALQQRIKDEAIEYLDLKFCDMTGIWHHVTLPQSALTKDLCEFGVGVDGSSMPGFTSIERGDMVVLPDLSTAFVDPFSKHKTLSILGDIYDIVPGENALPYSRNPRRVARDGERYLEKMLPGCKAILGPEFEFYVFDHVDFGEQPGQTHYCVHSTETQLHPQNDAHGFQMGYKRGYHAAPPLDHASDLRSDITTLLNQVGVGLKYHHHEVGTAGQHEIEVEFASLLAMADKAMLTKYIVKNECVRQGMSATFMPKPLFNEPGSGLHVHQFLAKDGASIFYDPNGPASFSKIGLHYIGGLLKHAASLLAFTNPSTNSYKRLVPGFEAPVVGCYSVGNRTACIRIPGYLKDPRKIRMEFRPPDGTMNPYLAFTAMLMAGLDGIENEIDPGAPLDQNLELLSDEERAQIPELPTSLEAALNALEVDHDYLLKGGVFTKDLVDHWIALKRKDVAEARQHPTTLEYMRYYAL